MISEKKRCLIITPKFYSFAKYISQELSSQGYEVEIINDEYPANPLGKVIGTLQLPVVFRITEKKILSLVEGKSYELIFIIKGRGMSTSLLQKLKKKAGYIVAYTFDSFKYHPSPLKWLNAVDRFYTFDFDDAEVNKLSVVELYSSVTTPNRVKKNNYYLSAIFRNHSNRLKYLDTVLNEIENNNIFIYVYEKDYFTFIYNFIKQPLLYLKYKKHIHFKALDYKVYIDTLYDSEFTLDYCHPYQSGITMRCFEALSLNTKILSNNKSNSKSRYFNEKNVITFNLGDDVNSLNESMKGLEGKVPDNKHRTLQNFLQEIIPAKLYNQKKL